MDFRHIARISGQFLNRNSTTILSSVAVVGTVSTAILAGKAAWTQGWHDAIDTEYTFQSPSFKESVQKHWKLYIPAASVGALTVGCIIGANTIGMRKTAAIASAYGLTERAFSEYQDKVRTTFGEKKEQEVRDDIAKDQMAANPASAQVIVGTGEHLCYDTLSGRYFKNNIEAIRKIENDINQSLIHGTESISQNDFYHAVGLPRLDNGDRIGWSDENLMELIYSSHLSDENVPCIAIGHRNLPKEGFWKSN